MPSNQPAYLSLYGEKLLSRGWDILPVKPGTKRPPMKGWEEAPNGQKDLKHWLNGAGFSSHGICVRTKNTPAVDIDVTDREIANKIQEYVYKVAGETLVRVGLAPKRLLVYRCNTPFVKVQTSEWIDPNADDAKVQRLEILGDGQQFVAYAIHPDTSQPYVWTSFETPLDTETWELPVLTPEIAEKIKAYAEKTFEKAGWVLKKSLKRSNDKVTSSDKVHVGTIDDEDSDWNAALDKTEHEIEEMRAIVMAIPNEGDEVDYESWREIGMAIWHQTDGSQEGFELFDEWSQQSAKYNKKETSTKAKWKSFDHKGTASPITFRVVLDRAKPYQKKVSKQLAVTWSARLAECKTSEALETFLETCKGYVLTDLDRNKLVIAIQQAYKKLNGVGISQAKVEKALKQPAQMRRSDRPDWLEGWTYLSNGSIFLNYESGRRISRPAFNDLFNTHMLTDEQKAKGLATPAMSAADFALNLGLIPKVHQTVYFPKGSTFETEGFLDEDEAEQAWRFCGVNGLACVNTYTDKLVPSLPTKNLTDNELKDIEVVKHHLLHRVGRDERTCKYLFDWFAYMVKTGNKCRWAVLIQGTEGTGKTIFADLMAAVLGGNNVTTINGSALESEFTGFAEGHQLCVVEELKMPGHNRHDPVNRIKPYITNNTVSIRRMRENQYTIPNATNYLILTNFQDAMPVSDNDRRYMIMFSPWQTKQQLAAFLETDPEYFLRLVTAIRRSPGALRQMFVEHEYSDGFNAEGWAPESDEKKIMASLGKTDATIDFEDILDEGLPGCNETLFMSHRLNQNLEEQNRKMFSTSSVNRLLAAGGFVKLSGRNGYEKFNVDGRICRVFTKFPKTFGADEYGRGAEGTTIAKVLKKQTAKALEDDDL